MYKVTKDVNVSTRDIHGDEELMQGLNLRDLSNLDWKAMSPTGSINLGPFKITYNLHVNWLNLKNSYFEVKIIVMIPLLPDLTIIDSRIDKDHATIGYDDNGFKALVKFDLDDLELSVELGAFGHSWEYTIIKL